MRLQNNTDVWLIQASAWQRVERVLRLESLVLSEAQTNDFAARTSRESSPAGFSISPDGVATIEIFGVLTPEPDWILQYFGGGNTAYSEIQLALVMAEGDARVKSVELHISSPGGTVAGLFETLEAIGLISKPITAIANLAASAAYAIASACASISATGPAATFGSIGVVASYYVDADIVEITSSGAPDKRPDVTTDKGQAVVRDYLDEIENLFVGQIATGRGIDAEKVKADFGGGRVFLAAESQRRGMIDGISQSPSAATETNETAECSATGVIMKLENLKTEHPSLYAEVLNLGATQERERVCAHLKMGKAYKATDVALKAIEAGTELTPTMLADYLSSGKDAEDAALRSADNANAAAAVAGVSQSGEALDLGDQLALKTLGKVA